MTITYSLNPTQIDNVKNLNGLSDVVVKVHWAYVGTTDDNRTAAYGGSTELTYVQGENFTPYDQLTKEQVADWVLSSWTQEQTDSYKSLIESQLAVKTDPLPWVKPEEPVQPEPIVEPVSDPVVEPVVEEINPPTA